MYRPQMAFPAPQGCDPQPCQFSFDQTNLPAIASGSLGAGARTGRIPLRLDKDAAFVLRAIKSQGTLSFRLENASGDALSDVENATESTNYEIPGEYARTVGAGFAILEGGEGVLMPPGSNFVLYLYNNTGASVNLNTMAFNLIGEKRYSEGVCA